MFKNSLTREIITYSELIQRYPHISFPDTIEIKKLPVEPQDEFDPPDDWEHYIPPEPPPTPEP